MGQHQWFEFWPILTYMRDHDLEEDTWYGFVSPSFSEKTGFAPEDVFDFVRHNSSADVALFSYNWAAIAYFRNPWEQGESWHPGLIAAAERFFASCGETVDLQSIYSDFETAVFSNYIVARSNFWRSWQGTAERYLAYVEGHRQEASLVTTYKGRCTYRMSVFIQERLASHVLSKGGFNVAWPDYLAKPIPIPLKNLDNPRGRDLLRRCETAKRRFRKTGRARDLWPYRIARLKLSYMLHGGSILRWSVAATLRILQLRHRPQRYSRD
jgi:hypothetical protein